MDFLLLGLFSLMTGYLIFKKMKEWQNLPPGPWGVPILGYLPFLNRNQPHVTLTQLAEKYGPMYGISMGSVYAVVLADHKLIREAFAKDEFSGRAPLYLTHGIMHGNGIICAEGNLWKDQRKLVSAWLKSFGVSKSSAWRDKLERRIAAGAEELLQNMENIGDEPADLSKMMGDALGNVVNEIIFGFKFPKDDKTWRWFREIQEEGCHEMGVAGVVNFLPFVRHFSPDIRNTIQVLVRGQAQTHRLYGSIVCRRRRMLGLETPHGAAYPPHENLHNEHTLKCVTYSKHSESQEHYFDPETLIPTEGDCVLDKFLEEQKRRFEAGDEAARFTTDEQMLYLMADLFGAGLDTTSVTMAWFLLFMALHPDEQELIRAELGAAAPAAGSARLMAAVCETQRIRSVVPVGIPHGCLKETYLGCYKVPRGAMVVPLQWAVHMDPARWQQPHAFRPARFLAADGTLLKPQEFIPFQTGKRMCPGDELSRMLLCGVLARLLRRWRLRPVAPVSDLSGKVGLTLAPPHVLYLCERV